MRRSRWRSRGGRTGGAAISRRSRGARSVGGKGGVAGGRTGRAECLGSVNGPFCHVIRARNELIRLVEHLVQH